LNKPGKYSGITHGPLEELAGKILGKNICLCPLCNELFSTERNFVSHRIDKIVGNNPGSYYLGPCRDPRTKGLALSHRGVWKMAPAEERYTDGEL
jgi:hypothetical protein